MDKPHHHHLILLGILFFVSLSKCSVAPPPSQTPEVKRTVMCLLDNRTHEISLDCGEAAAIHFKSVLIGFQDIPQDMDPPICNYQEEDECGISEPELYDTLVEKCMGTSNCLVPVKKIFLNPCGRRSDYVQVEYECISEISPPQNIIDVCGDLLGKEQLAQESGYIITPNYPSRYPPDESCMCSINAINAGTQFKLSVLDMDIHSVEKNKCVGDWLEYTTPGEVWGEGTRLCDPAANSTYSILNNFELHFRADSEYESRGFWIKYQGIDESGQPATVRVSCHQYHPTVNDEAGQCLSADNPSEISLDCTDHGVIEVTGVKNWNKNDMADCPELAEHGPNCHEDADAHPMMESCMGQTKCNVPITSQPLTASGCSSNARSNYVEVQFKCIADADQVHNIVDVCGDSLNGSSINRKAGFIESPDYPHKYPPNVNCQCRLTSTEDASTIQLRIIDVEVTGSPNTMCRNDWLEYTTDPLDWNKGTKICDGLRRDEILDTDRGDIYLNFNSDSLQEYRGFWIQYGARRLNEEGLEVPVRVTCYQWLEGDRLTISDGSEPSKTGTKSGGKDKNTALIVGLTVVIVFMLLLCIGMVLYKVKDSRKKYPAGQSTPVDTPLEKSYNSLKRYSTLNEEQGPRPRGGHYHMNQTEYQRAALAANQLNLPASYINPVFDKSPVV